MILTRIKNYFITKIYKPLLGFLKDGITPKKLAQSVAVGVIIGISPIIGTSTAIGFALGFLFRLNHAALQLVNYAVYPIQIALLIPIIQLGMLLTGSSISSEKIDEVISLVTEDVWFAIGEVGYIILAAVLGWMVIALPIYLVIYNIFLRIFNKAISSQHPVD